MHIINSFKFWMAIMTVGVFAAMTSLIATGVYELISMGVGALCVLVLIVGDVYGVIPDGDTNGGSGLKSK